MSRACPTTVCIVTSDATKITWYPGSRDAVVHCAAGANLASSDGVPVIQITVEMFRLGAGIQRKEFAREEAARSWLRTKGIAA